MRYFITVTLYFNKAGIRGIVFAGLLWLATITCPGQSLFFDNLNGSTWTSAPILSDSAMTHTTQMALSALTYPKDSIHENVSVWHFKDSTLTILNYNAKQKTESWMITYPYKTLADKGILQLIRPDHTTLNYKTGITSSGSGALLLRIKEKKQLHSIHP